MCVSGLLIQATNCRLTKACFIAQDTEWTSKLNKATNSQGDFTCVKSCALQWVSKHYDWAFELHIICFNMFYIYLIIIKTNVFYKIKYKKFKTQLLQIKFGFLASNKTNSVALHHVAGSFYRWKLSIYVR